MDARKALLDFLDEQVFLPAANADRRRYNARDRTLLLRAQHSVRGTRLKYYEEYTTAERVKANFRSDLSSSFGQKLAADMYLLKLARFEDVKDECFDLCRRHEL